MTLLDPALMEAVIDGVVAETQLFCVVDDTGTDVSDTTNVGAYNTPGIADVIPVENVFWTDPGIIGAQYYPSFTIEPVRVRPAGGSTGFDFRDLQVRITFLIDYREYWTGEPGPDDPGLRTIVRVGDRLEAWFRARANQKLGGISGVQSVEVAETTYAPQVRGTVFAKSAQLLLTVRKNRRR